MPFDLWESKDWFAMNRKLLKYKLCRAFIWLFFFIKENISKTLKNFQNWICWNLQILFSHKALYFSNLTFLWAYFTYIFIFSYENSFVKKTVSNNIFTLCTKFFTNKISYNKYWLSKECIFIEVYIFCFLYKIFFVTQKYKIIK